MKRYKTVRLDFKIYEDEGLAPVIDSIVEQIKQCKPYNDRYTLLMTRDWIDEPAEPVSYIVDNEPKPVRLPKKPPERPAHSEPINEAKDIFDFIMEAIDDNER